MKSDWTVRVGSFSWIVVIASMWFVASTTSWAQDHHTNGQNAVSANVPIHVPTAASREAQMDALNALERLDLADAGIQWHSPAANIDGEYRAFSDNGAGGISGDEFGLNLSTDADVYKGLIGGFGYGYTHRDGESGATDEDLDSHALSLYTAYRFCNLINAGASLSYISTDHEVGGANLDSDALSLNWFAGVSKTWEKITGSTTGSAIFTEEWFDDDTSSSTWTLAWSGSLAYQLHEQWRLGFNWWYNYVVDEPGDSGYWMFGPKLDYQVTDKVSVNLAYYYTDGPSEFNSQTVRIGAGVQF